MIVNFGAQNQTKLANALRNHKSAAQEMAATINKRTQEKTYSNNKQVNDFIAKGMEKLEKTGESTGAGEESNPYTKWLEERQNEIDSVQKQLEEYKNRDKKMETICNKLNSGKKLTPDEKEHLRQKNPEMYQQLKASEAEQQAYESALKRCRTKDEVKRLKMIRMGQSLETINEIKNNPHIPKGKKLALTMVENQKVARLLDIEKKYVESGAYEKLPTEYEKHQAEKEIREAKEAEIKENVAKQKEAAAEAAQEQAVQQPDKVETAWTEGSDEGLPQSQSQSQTEAGREGLRQPQSHHGDRINVAEQPVGTREIPTDGMKHSKEKIDVSVSGDRKVSRAGDGVKTVAEAENSPAAQKVKRAKAMAAYTKATTPELTTLTVGKDIGRG